MKKEKLKFAFVSNDAINNNAINNAINNNMWKDWNAKRGRDHSEILDALFKMWNPSDC